MGAARALEPSFTSREWLASQSGERGTRALVPVIGAGISGLEARLLVAILMLGGTWRSPGATLKTRWASRLGVLWSVGHRGPPGVLTWARGQSHCWRSSPGKAPLPHRTWQRHKAPSSVRCNRRAWPFGLFSLRMFGCDLSGSALPSLRCRPHRQQPLSTALLTSKVTEMRGHLVPGPATRVLPLPSVSP